jgi:hypothetical protein
MIWGNFREKVPPAQGGQRANDCINRKKNEKNIIQNRKKGFCSGKNPG